jgi:hypothetical protein
MIGSEPPQLAAREATLGGVVLEVRDLSLPRRTAFGVDLQDISLRGARRRDRGRGRRLGQRPAGADGRAVGRGHGAPRRHALAVRPGHRRASPRRRRVQGLYFVPEERLGRGAVPTAVAVVEHAAHPAETVSRLGWIDVGATRALAARLIERFKVKAGGPEAHAKSLSGGNLQKFIVGREIDAQPKRADRQRSPPGAWTWAPRRRSAANCCAARRRLRAARGQRRAGRAVRDQSDRLVVIARGRLSPSIAARDATVEQIGQWMSGLWDPAAGTAADPSKEARHAEA